ncbi:MAG: hypothetical protein C0410_07820, partial [Anaerolinea sp.]|nr:hypothetical protein [Anaerolinea sp.]
MSETLIISGDELDVQKERARKLAKEKSYLQLIVNLINRLSAAPGLEDTAEAIVRIVLESIGGTKVSLYYFIDMDIFHVDVFGERKKLDHLEDTMVKKALET